MMLMKGLVVKVQREKLAACMTCPLCNKLFRDATTISECLHSFCRRCIYEKITDEELDSCPVCDIELGCAPLEKLRADHNLQDLRTKIFPSKRQKPKASPDAEHFPVPGRRKERSLSSLVVGTPKVLVKSAATGKRSKPIAEKNPMVREFVNLTEEPVKEVNDHHGSLSLSNTLSKIAQIKKQNNSSASSKQHMPNKDTRYKAEQCEGKADAQKSLNCILQAATGSKPNKSNQQEILLQRELHDAQENEDQDINACVKEHSYKSKVNGDDNNTSASVLGSLRPRRLQGVGQKGAVMTEDLNSPAQAGADLNSNYDGRFTPIWFSLVASNNQDGDKPLPQISSRYLRVKDGSLQVSTIKMYLVQKLGLASEEEVEILIRGQPVPSTLRLHSLVDWWLQTVPASERIQTAAGCSAKDFVMVMSYSRKAHPL